MTVDESVDTLDARLRRDFVVTDLDVPIGEATFSLVVPRNSDDLIREEDYVRDERLPYWADLWPSSRALAAHMLASDGRGRRLLELGCGAGLVAAAAARAGYEILATDYYEDALDFARVNATRNTPGADDRFAVRHVDWRAFPEDLGTFDVVVASDVLYEQEYGRLVAAAIARTLGPEGRAIIADPGRIAADDFVRECGVLGLIVPPPTEVPYVDGEIRQRIRLYEIRWGVGE
ncbi:MAG TPA: methyltransferase domain-containing protein [Gemmatimonadaceae bacterium]|nr:methyltransferase domain-containing protein [Gemmatimonadaceae bacterium]